MITIAEACSRWPLQRAPAAILARLSQSPGIFVEMQGLRDALEEATGSRVNEESVRTAVRRLRAVIGGDWIENRKGVGYRLTRALEPE